MSDIVKVFKVPLNPNFFFHINKLSLLPLLLWQTCFGPGFFLQMLYLFKVRKLGAFLAHGRQYRIVGLLYFVTSSQGFHHAQNKQTERQLFFFSGCLIRVLCLDVTTKVKEMAELCTEYPFFNNHRPELVKRRKKWIDFVIFHWLCLFRASHEILIQLMIFSWQPHTGAGNKVFFREMCSLPF